MRRKIRVVVLFRLFFLALIFAVAPLWAVELQGFLTRDCQAHTGMIVHVEDGEVAYIDLNGELRRLPERQIQTLYTFDVLVNPFAKIKIDAAALPFLTAVYVESGDTPNTFAFTVRFVDDLVIFYGLDGKTRVFTYTDLLKLRPAGEAMLGSHVPPEHRPAVLDLNAQSDRCSVGANTKGTKATRILNDQIAIDSYLSGFEKGYGELASFQERTYLYPRPMLFPPRARLGLTFQGAKEEPNLPVPVYFQWSSGEPYRFQSFTVVGLKSNEFTPNTEPQFSLRSDVKSHVFHALFIGNVVGLPAGNSTFLKPNLLKLSDPFSVEPNLNYMALMGADVGPYSASVGLFYPTFAFRVNDEYREVLGSSVSYIARAMYTTPKLRLRAITSLVRHSSNSATDTDVIKRTKDNGDLLAPDSFNFKAYFLRAGLDYDWNESFRTGADATVINGDYHETVATKSNSLKFNKLTLQAYIERHFGHYVSLSAYLNLIQRNYDSNVLDQPLRKNNQESVFFGSLEFLF